MNNAGEFVLLASILVYSGFLIFLISGFRRLRPGKSRWSPSVTIVVAAHNEETIVGGCLEALLGQDYPRERLQIVCVDDRSTDRTRELLQVYRERHPTLVQVVAVSATPAGTSPKKHALAMGIAQASGEVIFSTDADCAPPPAWIRSMLSYFDDQTGLVIGPAPVGNEASFWQRLIRIDTLAKELVSAGSAGWQAGVSCTGRSLAYRKAAYTEINGFESFKQSLSGDDDLLLQHINRKTPWRIAYVASPGASVPSPAPGTLRRFSRQRRRHVSAARFYPRKLQLAFALFNLVNVIILAAVPIAAITQLISIRLAVVSLFFKLIGDYIGLYLINSRLDYCRSLRLLPVWEVFNLLNQVIISSTGLFVRIQWHHHRDAEGTKSLV